jgi:hypothetical protein
MVFNKAARGERKLGEKAAKKEVMTQRGWCETLVPVMVLEDARIPHDAETTVRASRYSILTTPYVPAWVYAVWFNSEQKTNWATMRPVLEAVRDDPREQEVLCSELSLNLDVARSIRDAARHFVDHLHHRPIE